MRRKRRRNIEELYVGKRRKEKVEEKKEKEREKESFAMLVTCSSRVHNYDAGASIASRKSR